MHENIIIKMDSQDKCMYFFSTRFILLILYVTWFNHFATPVDTELLQNTNIL